MNEEYEALKAQKDAIDKKSKQQYVDQGVSEERARIRAAVEKIGTFPICDEWNKGFMRCRELVIDALKAGDPHEALPKP
ncbi:hypothetical protein FDZ73_22355 [bacterium]|nr:MAG: hypothetical protein FDZ73_22355 [bacterium]